MIDAILSSSIGGGGILRRRSNMTEVDCFWRLFELESHLFSPTLPQNPTMKNIISAIALLTMLTSCSAQRYVQYQKVNGLEISTKWGQAKDADGVKKDALLLKVENTADQAVTLAMDINLYYEGMLRESGRIEGECIPGLKSRVGKLNGIYFVPENFSSEQLTNSSFNFTLDEIEVEEVEGCED